MESHMWSTFVSKRQINTFLSNVNNYCKKNKLSSNTLKTFLNHKDSDEYVSKTYSQLFTAPKLLLAGSCCFEKYYRSLDVDFRNDIMTESELHDLRIHLLRDKTLKQFLKNKLRTDFIYQ